MARVWHRTWQERPTSERTSGAMTVDDRSDRTARLLIARLDALACVATGLPHVEAERLVELAAVATFHAVALELLQAERAESIWREAELRDPRLAIARRTLAVRAAA